MAPEDAAPPDSVAVRVAIGVAQPVSPGPNNWNVTVPVGLDPPDKVAGSEMFPPAGTDPEGVVVMVGGSFGTCSVIDSVKPVDRTPLSRKSALQVSVLPGTAP